MKRVLILGAGLVSRPMVNYLLQLPDVETNVATRTVKKAEELIGGHPRGKAIPLLIEDETNLHKLVQEADVVVSLLPYIYHLNVARHCLELKKHLITTSYVSEQMRSLHDAAKKAGVLFLNEIGLDPGIDHMSAMAIIERVKDNGGRIISFVSSCGGLPAPEANNNPLGYKFSWSPKGVLMAGRNEARFLKNGEEKVIPGNRLFASYWKSQIPGVGELEVYPNRNSLPYIDLYGLKGIKTMIRATLRNPGWCEFMNAIVNLGLIKDDRVRNDIARLTYARWLREFVPGTGNLRSDAALQLGVPEDHPVIQKLVWLGLFEEKTIPLATGNNVDILAQLMVERMSYQPGERDMIVLHHQFDVEYPGRPGERIDSTLVDFGIPNGDSAMARTVSLPAAIAVRMLLEGRLPLSGVQIPVIKEIYQPILAELETLGIKFQEQTAIIS